MIVLSALGYCNLILYKSFAEIDNLINLQSLFLYIPQREERKDFNKLSKASFAVVILGSNLETDCPNTLPCK